MWTDNHKTMIFEVIMQTDNHKTIIFEVIMWTDNHKTIFEVIMWTDNHKTISDLSQIQRSLRRSIFDPQGLLDPKYKIYCKRGEELQ